MSSLNKVTLIGNLGRDPEVRQFPNGGQVCNLSIATSERWKGKDGKAREKPEWHRVAIFNEGLIKVAQNYLKKGSKVYIEGQLETRKWQDKSGNDQYSTGITLRGVRCTLTMLDNPKSDGARTSSNQAQPTQDFSADMDDNVPF